MLPIELYYKYKKLIQKHTRRRTSTSKSLLAYIRNTYFRKMLAEEKASVYLYSLLGEASRLL